MAILVEVLEAALSLEVRDRAALAEELLASIEHPTEEEVERLWSDEVQHRSDEYRAGRADAVEANAVHAKAEQLFS